jgi:hypothetical protein
MPHYRSSYRTVVRTALEAQPDFAEYQSLSAWSQTIDSSELPFFAVATPTERKERDTHTSSARETMLFVVFKKRGGDDLEDELDDLSIVAEQAVLLALEDPERECILTETNIELDGSAGTRVGTLSMKFTVTIWPLEPITL